MSSPSFTPAEASVLVRENYGIEAEASLLVSYIDQNFRLETPGGECFVLKIWNRGESLDRLDLQERFQQRLQQKEVPCPAFIPTLTGDLRGQAEGADGSTHVVHMITWAEGHLWADLDTQPSALLRDFGAFLGRLTQAAEGFEHPAAHRPDYIWDLRYADVLSTRLDVLTEREDRHIVEHFLRAFDQRVRGKLNGLRRSVIHNDANDLNIFATLDPPRVLAVIDFGDVCHTATICELAIGIAYAMLDQEEPLDALEHMVAGYHDERGLLREELEILLELAALRLCSSLVNSLAAYREDPDNDYLLVSVERGRRVLRHLVALDPRRIFFRLLEVCDLEPEATPPLSSEQILQRRRTQLGSNLSLSYRKPLHIVRGFGTHLYDSDGRAYLDMVNNVCHVGHCHPRVVAAAQQQMERLNTNTRYLHENLVLYAERLAAALPDPLEVCFFVCTGSEANELALRMARAATGGSDFLTLEGAYHGHTSSLIDVSPYKFDRKGGSGAPAHVRKVPMPDVYRGLYKADDPDAGAKYAVHVRDEIGTLDGRLAGFFSESALGCGGQIFPPAGYLEDAFAFVRAAGGLCIADEVQVGFGRVGSHFWAFETHSSAEADLVPDIVTMGKPIGNGHPLAAVVTTREIADAFANGMEYFNTFGGNPVSCAVGLAVLDVIEEEGLQENARRVGEAMLDGLRALQKDYELIGDVRGRGLFVGVELVRDRETLEPATEEASRIVDAMKDRGILLSTDGPLENVIKIKPPIVFSMADNERFLTQLGEVFGAYAEDSTRKRRSSTSDYS